MKTILTLALMAAIASSQAAVISLATPVSNSLTPSAIYWDYNSSSGSVVSDGSGNGYGGTLTVGLDNSTPVNTPTLATGVDLAGTSGYGQAVSVVGKNNNPAYTSNMNPSVRYGPGAAAAYAMSGGVSFTGGTWVNMNIGASTVPVDTNLNMYLMGSGQTYATSSHWGLVLARTSGGAWSLGLSVGSGAAQSSVFTSIAMGDVLDSTWHHVGFNYNGTTNEVTLWIDGVSIATNSLTNGIGAPANLTDRTFRVGERVESSFEELSFTGKFDDTFVTSGIHTFTAVPEPSITALMMGVAVLLAASFRRWSKSRRG